MNVFALLEESARRYGEDAAVFHATHRHATYAELTRKALALGAAIRAFAPPGNRVMVVSPNCPEYVEVMFGIWAAGMIAVPINAKLHPREMGEIVTDCGAVLAFTSATLEQNLRDSGCVVVAIGSAAYNQMLAHEPAAPCERLAEDIAWLFFTSGTTGRSKGAMLTHRNLVAMAIAHVADLEPLGRADSIIHAAPMSHGSGLYMLPYAMRAARHIIPASGGFEPLELLDLAHAYPAAGAFLTPTMVRRLRLAMAESGRKEHGLRSIIYGGGPMYLDEIKQALEVFGPVLRQLYGQGESPMTITGLRAEDHINASEAVLNSVGWPRSGVEVRIIDENGRPLPAGELGEVACRSDVVMAGYWNDAKATAAALHDGWLLTGDIGSVDASGCLTLRDRRKDVIISGGSNIYPREVEEALLAHPEVAEVCVIGLRDAEWGEIVAAVIVRESGSTVAASALDRHCLDQIARFKRPKRYIFVDALTKSSYGKVLKREIARSLAEPPLTSY